MGHTRRNFLSFCNTLVCVQVDNTSVGLEIYTQVLQTCSLLDGCPGRRSGSEFQLVAVGHFVLKFGRMDSWDTDSEDSCDWGDSSEDGSSSEEDDLDVKYDKE